MPNEIIHDYLLALDKAIGEGDPEGVAAAQSAIAEYERGKLRQGLDAVERLIINSSGVTSVPVFDGLRSEDEVPWHDLRTGGKYESWLYQFDDALALLPELENTPAFAPPPPTPPEVDNEKIALRAALQYVLKLLRPQARVVNPSLLVVRECVRELSRYDVDPNPMTGKSHQC